MGLPWGNKRISIKSDLRKEVYIKLAENNLNIPFPQRDIHIKGMEQMVDFQEKKAKN